MTNTVLKALIEMREEAISADNTEEKDALYDKIRDYLLDQYQYLSVEDILEADASIGGCMSLLYDDNGHWAIGTDGTQNIDLDFDEKKPEDNCDFYGTWFLQKDDWKDSVKEAVNHYFERKKQRT